MKAFTKLGPLRNICTQLGGNVSIIQSSGLLVIQGFKCIEVNVETIWTFRIVYYIVGDCCREANLTQGSSAV